MNDDWRVRVTLLEPDDARELVDKVGLRELERDVVKSLHDRVVVSRDDEEVFLYAGTREQAEAAEEQVKALAAQHGWEAQFELSHWHPTAEEWEDPDKPLPATDAERAAEHAELIAQERAQQQAQGYPDYEVRVQCASHPEAAELGGKLGELEIPYIQRSKYVLVGAPDEDTANELAARIKELAPDGATVTVEGTFTSVEANEPPSRFAIFRGIFG